VAQEFSRMSAIGLSGSEPAPVVPEWPSTTIDDGYVESDAGVVRGDPALLESSPEHDVQTRARASASSAGTPPSRRRYLDPTDISRSLQRVS
jgi:hypothetical protein